MTVGVFVPMISTAKTGLLIEFMTGFRVGTVAMVRLRHFFHPSAITQITPAKAEDLRPPNSQNSQQWKEMTCEV